MDKESQFKLKVNTKNVNCHSDEVELCSLKVVLLLSSSFSLTNRNYVSYGRQGKRKYFSELSSGKLGENLVILTVLQNGVTISFLFHHQGKFPWEINLFFSLSGVNK